MSRVVVLGIDGMDRLLLGKWRTELPNLTRLAEGSPRVKMESIFPPDSLPAWLSIYTGLSPAKLGVIRFVTPFHKLERDIFGDTEQSSFKGKTFWDIASAAGKRVCIVLPHAVYPSWHVNGTMACRTEKVVSRNFPLSIYPPEPAKKYQMAGLQPYHGFPPQRLFPKFIRSCRERTLAEAGLGLKLLREEPWDLFFIYFSALDGIEHTFWRCLDPADPGYPGPNPYQDTIKEFYKLHDKIIGEFISSANEATVMVISDHGHGMRPPRVVNLNQKLVEWDLLVPRVSRLPLSRPSRWKERVKSSLSILVNRLGIGNFALKIMYLFPYWKRFLSSPELVDNELSQAYISDISAVKAHSQGGIVVKPGAKYEEVREILLQKLPSLEDPETGTKLVKWVSRREDIYSGGHLSRYPDILFELVPGYGVGWALEGPFISNSYFHAIQPGGHKRETPVFLVGNSVEARWAEQATILDIAPTILKLLGIPAPEGIDGKCLIKESPEIAGKL